MLVAGPTRGVFDYSSAFPAPPAKPLDYPGLLEAMANGKTFSFDLQTITQIVEEANVSVAIEGAGILHLTGFDDTPGSFFFSTQGPENIEVSFSATQYRDPDPRADQLGDLRGRARRDGGVRGVPAPRRTRCRRVRLRSADA